MAWRYTRLTKFNTIQFRFVVKMSFRSWPTIITMNLNLGTHQSAKNQWSHLTTASPDSSLPETTQQFIDVVRYALITTKGKVMVVHARGSGKSHLVICTMRCNAPSSLYMLTTTLRTTKGSNWVTYYTIHRGSSRQMYHVHQSHHFIHMSQALVQFPQTLIRICELMMISNKLNLKQFNGIYPITWTSTRLKFLRETNAPCSVLSINYTCVLQRKREVRIPSDLSVLRKFSTVSLALSSIYSVGESSVFLNTQCYILRLPAAPRKAMLLISNITS